MSGLIATEKPYRIKATHRRRWKAAAGHRPYANNNPYKFTDPDGRQPANSLGVTPKVDPYGATPTQELVEVVTEIVDTTVELAVSSGQQDQIERAKSWDVSVTGDPKTPAGHAADTFAETADQPVSTLFSAGVLEFGDTSQTFDVEGIIAAGGDPAFEAVGAHELFGHGPAENGAVPSGPANEADATRRAWEMLKSTPGAANGSIKCTACP